MMTERVSSQSHHTPPRPIYVLHLTHYEDPSFY